MYVPIAILHSPTVLGPTPIFRHFSLSSRAPLSAGAVGSAGPIIVPFVLNFRTRHIEIDRKRLALFDRNRDRDHALGEEWRHDPGHRGNVPYRDAAVSAMFGSGTPAANFNPAIRGRLTGSSRVERPLAAPLPQKWQRPGFEDTRSPLDAGRTSREGIRAPLEGGRPSNRRHPAPLRRRAAVARGRYPTFRPLVDSGAQPFGGRGPGAIAARPFGGPRLGTVQPALEGVDPTWDRAPVGPALDPDAERRILIERWSFGRVPPTALAAPSGGGLRASPSFGRILSTQSFGGRRSFRPLVGIGAQPFSGRGPGAIGAPPFRGRGPQTPSGGMGAGGGRGGS